MNVLKTPSFFRPASRPSSPAPTPPPALRSDPTPVHSTDRTARPLNKLALSTFRRPSPASASSPRATPTPLVQDGSYLEMLSLKLSEAVSRALAQPSGPALPYEIVAGKRPLPSGRGHALGTLIASYVFIHIFCAVVDPSLIFQRIKGQPTQFPSIPRNPSIASSAAFSSTYQLICPPSTVTLISPVPLAPCTSQSEPEYECYANSCSRYRDICA